MRQGTSNLPEILQGIRFLKKPDRFLGSAETAVMYMKVRVPLKNARPVCIRKVTSKYS